MVGLFLAVAAGGALGCAPGLVGTWHGSMTIPHYPTRKLTLVVSSELKGTITVTAGQERVTAPLCKLKLEEHEFSFSVDLANPQSCDALKDPIVFRGVLGHNVLTGETTLREKTNAIWRAFRQAPKDQ